MISMSDMRSATASSCWSRTAAKCIFHVLVDQDGAVSGRFNLYDVVDGSAKVGYRVAQRVAGPDAFDDHDVPMRCSKAA